MKKIINWVKNLFGTGRINTSLGKALDAAAPNSVSWIAGEENFDDMYFEKGESLDKSIEAALDAAAPDGDSWITGKEVFYKTLKNVRKKQVMFVTSASLVCLFLIVGVANVFAATINTTADPNALSGTSVTSAKVEAIAAANKALQDAGWKPNEYSLNVDASTDTSTSGPGAFTKENIKSTGDMVRFLKENSDESKTIVSALKQQTGASDAEILDVGNWVAVQSKTEYRYPGNTSFSNGSIVDVGARDGSNGDIFFLFVPPNGNPPVPFRGACGNPQRGMPTPNIITVTPARPSIPGTPDTPITPPGDTPKSSDIEDYQRPGTDDTTDSGVDVKPVVPPVTTPVEETPPAVDTEEPGGGGVVDTPTNEPGSETGVDIPDSEEPTRVDPPPDTDPELETPAAPEAPLDPGNPF